MKTVLLISLLTVASLPVYAECTAPQTSQEAISCMVQKFAVRKNNVINKSAEIYQYNYNLGYNSLATKVSTWDRILSAPAFVVAYLQKIVPDLTALYNNLKNKNFAGLPASFEKYQTDRRSLFSDSSTRNFATYLVKEQEQALGSIIKVSGNQAKATAYAQANYIGYLVPATLYELYYFINEDAKLYLNSATMLFSQADCTSSVSGFQSQFAKLTATNGTVNFVMNQAKPNSLVRQILPYVELGAEKKVTPYITGALDVTSAFTLGKVASGANYIDYDVCDYAVFTAVAATTTNPYMLQLNTMVNQLATKSGYPAQNIYWILTAVSSQSLTAALAQLSITSNAGVLPY